MDTNAQGYLYISEEMLSDLILCEPVTRKGTEALDRLGLRDAIDVDYFYKFLRVESKFDRGKRYETQSEGFDDSDKVLYYQYTVNYEQFEKAQNRLEEFDNRFESDIMGQSPLLMLGVAGNGKSIEVIRRIHELLIEKGSFSQVYIDLEYATTKLKYGNEFECPNKEDPIWLFCIKMFDKIITLISGVGDKKEVVYENYQKYLKPHHLVNRTECKIFEIIKQGDDDQYIPELFNIIDEYLSNTESHQALEKLLELLILILFCYNPNIKHYIVIDNIEQYIVLNDSKIQIPNRSLSIIYRTIKNVTGNMESYFNRISNGLIWKVLKIIIVLRRTSIGLLDPSFLQYPINGRENINDFTGHFQMEEIWKRKKTNIWENMALQA